MSRSLYALLAFLAVLLTGCVSRTQYIVSAPADHQRLVKITQNESILGVQEVTPGHLAEVLFEPTVHNTLFNGMALFWIHVENTGAESFRFGSNHVSVTDRAGRPRELLPIDVAVARLEKNRSRRDFVYGLAASFLAGLASAPYAAMQPAGIYHGTTSTGQPVSGTYRQTTPDPAVLMLAQQQGEKWSGDYSAQLMAAFAQARANVQRLALPKTDIAPGQKVEGIVLVPLHNLNELPNRWRFAVTVGERTTYHEFTVSSRRPR